MAGLFSRLFGTNVARDQGARQASPKERKWSALIVGAGIGGLSAAIAFRLRGIDVDIIDRDPEWSVYGVGIIQQANVIRAVAELGVIADYVDAGYGFDHVKIFAPNGQEVATVPTPSLAPGYPPCVGIGRRALQKVLGDKVNSLGANLRLGVTVEALNDDGKHVDVVFSDGTRGTYDFVVGADGAYSQIRKTVLQEATRPAFTGQSVWRYNFKRPDEVKGLWVYNGSPGVGLVPIGPDIMYMFVTTAEPENPRFETAQLAAEMRGRVANHPSPLIRDLAQHIIDSSAVVYRPLEVMMLEGAWNKGRTVLLGDAVHTTTPHLGQGAGLAIEDALVLADEISRAESAEAAFTAYRDRRFQRCAFVVNKSLEICRGQLGQGPLVDNSKATAEMFGVIAAPI